MKGPFKVHESVYCVGGGGISSAGDCLIYLIDAGEELILIDVGVAEYQRILNNIKKMGFEPNKISSIIITHAHIDHIGNLRKMKNVLKAKIYAHELECEPLENGGDKTADYFYGVKYKPVKVDIKFTQHLEKITIGNKIIQILHIPGHTVGGIAPFFDEHQARILFSQDTHGPLFPNLGSNKAEFVKSLKEMQELNADILCEGHFGIYEGKKEVFKYIQGYINEFSR